MKALTIQQPWAWAVIHGGKTVENRTQVWQHRGPLAVHAGARWSERGTYHPLVQDAAAGGLEIGSLMAWLARGAVIGTVDVVDSHVAEAGCCGSPWAEYAYEEHGSGKTRRDVTHLVVENPVALERPVPCRGALGLWTLPDHVAMEVSS